MLLRISVVVLALGVAAAEDLDPEPEPEHVYGWNCNTAAGVCHNNATAPAEYHTQEECRAVCIPPAPPPGSVGWECNSDTGNCQSNVRPRPLATPTLATTTDPAVGSSGYCEPAGPCTFLLGGAVPDTVRCPAPAGAGAGAARAGAAGAGAGALLWLELQQCARPHGLPGDGG